ncbi:MAG: hypothetical protein H6709_02960 [Kofleriaceae bacterium]|nr:hypothetical protein [Kofleriaceae bacterium]MCB9571028.1 hypothetical protein [Kofleriaceae bacterium]
MARRGGRAGRGDDDSTLDRIERALDRWPAGMHDLGDPGADVPHGWPVTLLELYMTWDGMRLFGEAIELRPSAEVERRDDRWVIGQAWGDDLAIDDRGRVWRDEDSVWVQDGTSIERWLAGAIDAEAMLYGGDGEFADDVFDAAGELVPAIAVAQVRAQIKRDGRAPGPRLRLARLLRRTAGDDPGHAARIDEARDLLERLVADDPAQPWAWLELARISEERDELAGALDELEAAGDAAAGLDDEAFFWAHAARVAAALGDEPRRAAATARARAGRARVVEDYVAGARDNLEAGELAAAGALIALARALAPRDLAAIELGHRIASISAAAAEAAEAEAAELADGDDDDGDDDDGDDDDADDDGADDDRDADAGADALDDDDPSVN